MPYNGAAVKDIFEDLKTISPDLIFTHYRRDAHQDHRFLCELTWNTFRDHLILEYEIPKWDGDMSQPNFFVPLELADCEKKIEYILDAFQSQSSKRWFRKETFSALMRLRGMECNSPSDYAEAFYCSKACL
jgi:LmbE family N-acetylglucosaminyl deacetylase